MSSLKQAIQAEIVSDAKGVIVMTTETGVILAVSRAAMDTAAAIGYAEDAERDVIVTRSDLDSDGLWVTPRLGNGQRAATVRVIF